MDKIPFKPNPNRVPFKPRKVKLGGRAIGIRAGSPSNGRHGTLIDAYYTINVNYKMWKNPAYVILCDDGRPRTYQYIMPEDGEKIKLDIPWNPGIKQRIKWKWARIKYLVIKFFS